MKWATPTWFFLHVFAEKINSDFFNNNKNECCNIITQICQNLPCPICSNHACAYIKKNKISKVQNKREFIIYLYEFHNYVNIMTKKERVNTKILEKYKTAKMFEICKYFFKRFFLVG